MVDSNFEMASTNTLGIPEAVFIDDIKAAAPTVEEAERLYQEKSELMQKYRLLENHLLSKVQQLKDNKPSVVENLTAVRKLELMADQGEKKTHFAISDSLYSSAVISSQSTVGLWLGANLMVEYPFSEAKNLLEDNLAHLDSQIEATNQNLSFLRDQIITTEVTLSRLVNQIIQLRKVK